MSMEATQFNALMQLIAKLSNEVALLSAKVDKLEQSIIQLRKNMEKGFADIRAEMAEEFAKVRAEMAEEFANVHAEMTQEFTNVRREMEYESKKQAAVHDEILRAFDQPFRLLEGDHKATKSNHGKCITKLERHNA